MFYQVFLVTKSKFNDKYNTVSHKVILFANSKEEAKKNAYYYFSDSKIVEGFTLVTPLNENAIYVFHT